MLASLFQLGWREIVSDIPTDTGAIVVYLTLAIFVGLIWYGSVRSRKSNPQGKSGGEPGGAGRPGKSGSPGHSGDDSPGDHD